MKKYVFFCLTFSLKITVSAQDLKLGGLQSDKEILITPYTDVNKELTGKTVWEAAPFGMKKAAITQAASTAGTTLAGSGGTGETYIFQPVLRKGQTWLAAFNFDFKGKKQNIFYYDSWVATTEKAARTGGRKRIFDKDVTALIASNAYHIAMQRAEVVENELFMFAYSPKKQKCFFKFDKKTVGFDRTISYDFEANEAKFIHVTIPPNEYTNVVWFTPQSPRDTMDIGSNWDFYFAGKNDIDKPSTTAQWEKINIPHTWNACDAFDPRPIKDSLDYMEFHKRGIGFYKKKIIIPANWQGKYLKIDCQGANTKTDIWINGQSAGSNNNGFLDFHFDITHLVKWGGENEFLIKVDNRFDYDIPPHTADYNFQGGIYRELSLITWAKTFVRRPKISTPKVSPTEASYSIVSNVRTKLNVGQKATLVVNVINPYNEIIATHTHALTIPADKNGVEITSTGAVQNPLLWSPNYPHLYKVQQQLYNTEGVCIDVVTDNFGLRFYNFDAQKGFTLNGRNLKLKGVNIHQDVFGKGWANSLSDKKRDFEMIKEMGSNFVRLSHYPHHPYVLHLCDSLGLMVWEEIPIVNTVGRDSFIKNAVKMMNKTIERDYNHPSVMMWGVGNEYYRAYYTPEDTEYALKCTKAVAEAAKRLDPFRPTVQAQNDLVDERIMPLTDIQGRNRYFGWYGKEPYQDFEHAMEEDVKKHPTWKIIISEYGAEGKYGYHVDKPVRFDHSLTYQLDFHKAYWKVIKEKPYIAGSALWNMFDFQSWAKIGNIPHLNQKGMATYDRVKKGLFYYYQSEWSSKPMVYIWEHTLTHRHGKKGELQPIEVFSNCDEVELFINDISQGKRKKADGYVWKVDFTEGYHDLKAIGHHQGETVKWTMEVFYQYSDKKTGKEKGNGVDDGF
jgi:beta-galactosidase